MLVLTKHFFLIHVVLNIFLHLFCFFVLHNGMLNEMTNEMMANETEESLRNALNLFKSSRYEEAELICSRVLSYCDNPNAFCRRRYVVFVLSLNLNLDFISHVNN